MMHHGIAHLGIADTPVAVIDFETSGLSPTTGARVVEVSVVRCDPGAEPRLVLDTLVDPQGDVGCTEIHGIEDTDVIGAPFFSDVAGAIAHAIQGAVVASYNVGFDIPFLSVESKRSRRLAHYDAPPHFCLMYLRTALRGAPRTSLGHALSEVGLPTPDHRAAHDALGAAMLWAHYRDAAIARGMFSFGDLLEKKTYKFMESWERDPVDEATARAVGPERTSSALMPRRGALAYGPYVGDAHHPHPVAGPVSLKDRLRTTNRAIYLQALVDVLSDHRVEPEEIATLFEIRDGLHLTPGDLRALHAAYFADALRATIADQFVSHDEVAYIAKLTAALSALGWAPGDDSR